MAALLGSAVASIRSFSPLNFRHANQIHYNVRSDGPRLDISTRPAGFGRHRPLKARQRHPIDAGRGHRFGDSQHRVLSPGKERYRESEAPTPIDKTSSTTGSGAPCDRAVAVRWC